MKIFIDQGHAKKGGAVASTGQSEARTNYNVALFLAPLLMKMGHDVSFARLSHEDSPTLEARGRSIRAMKPDMVISIHHNAFNKQARGAEVLVQSKDKNGGGSKLLGEKILEEFMKIGQISRGLVFRPNSAGTGDYYGILRYSAEVGACAVITEYAFMDNEEDLKLINSYDGQEKEAIAIALAIKSYTE